MPEYSSCATTESKGIAVDNLKSSSTIQCNISVESIAKMQETIDDYRSKLEWIFFRLIKPDKNPPLILKCGLDSSNDVFEHISRELSNTFEKLDNKFLVVKGQVIAPNIKCISYKDHPKYEILPKNEAIAFFPEENIPKDAIVIEGDVFITKEMLIDGYTLLCTKEISAYAAYD